VKPAFPAPPRHRPGFTVARTRRALDRFRDELAEGGFSLSLVPTMGGLHEGHLHLVDLARARADFVAASIFVNPLQFGPGEDLEHYPRQPENDVLLLQRRGAGVVFVPGDAEIYPDGVPQVQIDPGPLERRLCGVHRPGHFRGVLTVVAKLFGLVRPDLAVFGRKDLQQAVLIRRMVHDLNLPVEIVTGPLVREADGLAMSSRNAYLTPDARLQAPLIFRALSEADRRFREGEGTPGALLDAAREVLSGTPAFELQYLELVDPDSLSPLESAVEGSVIAVAGILDGTRLIDNLVLGAGVPDPHAGREDA
jgi:pantoate--beta-alanine ligase